jgi:pantoate kinase
VFKKAYRLDDAGSGMTDDGTEAFVPGHVTGFFTIHRDDDPTKTGSRGGGLTLTDGVTVTVQSAETTTCYLDGTSIEMEPVERVLGALEVTATVEAETSLPIGSGFGVSGAMALGTALAANVEFDRRLSENELVTIAHGAEVQSGTGLGDVVAQARGGIPLRLEPGGPQHNVLDGIPRRARVEYVTFGDLSTPDVLDEGPEAITQAGTRALSRVVGEPTLTSFIYASRRFAREAELLTPTVRDAIEAVNEAGGEASMAMLGESVFALGTGLTDAGYDPDVCATHPAGATLQ